MKGRIVGICGRQVVGRASPRGAALAASPGSTFSRVSRGTVDSGFALRAPRNDGYLNPLPTACRLPPAGYCPSSHDTPPDSPYKRAKFEEAPMTALYMIVAFIVVFGVLNLVTTGRVD